MHAKSRSWRNELRRGDRSGGWQARWARRIARWERPRLDVRLAAGAQAREGTPLEARGRELAELPFRWALADAWTRVLAARDLPGAAGHWRVLPRAETVDAARPAIAQLIAALYSTEALDPAGIAMAELLLTDGTGPLYSRDCPQRFVTAVQRCLVAFKV